MGQARVPGTPAEHIGYDDDRAAREVDGWLIQLVRTPWLTPQQVTLGSSPS